MRRRISARNGTRSELRSARAEIRARTETRSGRRAVRTRRRARRSAGGARRRREDRSGTRGGILARRSERASEPERFGRGEFGAGGRRRRPNGRTRAVTGRVMPDRRGMTRRGERGRVLPALLLFAQPELPVGTRTPAARGVGPASNGRELAPAPGVIERARPRGRPARLQSFEFHADLRNV